MSRTILVCLLVAALALCAYVAGMVRWQEPKVVASQKQKDDPDFIEVREIELTKVYSTSGQLKLKKVREPLFDDERGMKAIRALEDTLMTAKSPPLIGIVRGDSINEAVIASGRLVGMKKAPKSTVGPDDKSTSSKHWLFVYLGAKHSSPPHWIVNQVQMAGGRIRFSYRVFDFWPSDAVGQMFSLDFHPYLYWAPLDGLKDSSESDAELILIEQSVKATFPTKK